MLFFGRFVTVWELDGVVDCAALLALGDGELDRPVGVSDGSYGAKTGLASR